MKNLDLKKTTILKRTLHGRLFKSFIRAFGIIGNESDLTSDLQTSMRGSSGTFLTYSELQKMNAQLLKMERLKAEAMQRIREHNNCL